MTYGGFQRFDECQAYHKRKREQKEDDARQAEFDREIERQRDEDMDKNFKSMDVYNLENDDIEDLVNDESK